MYVAMLFLLLRFKKLILLRNYYQNSGGLNKNDESLHSFWNSCLRLSLCMFRYTICLANVIYEVSFGAY